MSHRRGSDPQPDPEVHGRDAGLSLVELIITTAILGIIMASISAAMIVILRTEKPTQARISESKDITFLQTWLPLDLASAINSDRSPTLQPASSRTLPGTNVLTLTRPDVTGATTVYYVVSYRYVNVGDEWRLVRYEIRNQGTASEQVYEVGVAHELPGPPAGWTPDQSPVHAIEVTARNQVILRPIGEDITVTFKSGSEFTTGGAGMSSEDQLPADYSGGLVDPSAPPSRCGGSVTLVLDTSTSIPNQNGEQALMDAAVGFIDAFVGTPTRMSVVGFDQKAYAMYPTTGGTFISLLTDTAGAAAMKTKIRQLENISGTWSWSNKDPGGDGFYFGFGWSGSSGPGGTNWEDGLWAPFKNTTGTPYTSLPETVVFITDGQPNRNRAGSASESTAVNSAISSANYGRGTGARVVGILVGSDATASKTNLKKVVGNNEWNGTGPTNPGNAAAADIFMPGTNGDFTQLGQTLKTIMVAQCGGTVTVQKKIDTGGGVLVDPTGPWTYTTELGVRTLDPARESSITFDYAFDTGVLSRDVTITETPQDGYQFDRAECSIGGVAVPARVSYPADGTGGAILNIKPDEAMSCILISEPI